MRISAPLVTSERDERGRPTGKRKIRFRTIDVFELSQTEPLADCSPRDARDGCQIDVPSAELFASLRTFAESLGYTVSFESMAGTLRGSCDKERRLIAVDARAPATAQLRTLIHECVHALGINYDCYPKDQAEVIAETVTYIVGSRVGLALEDESVPYVARWGREGAIEQVTQLAQTIDRLANRIERALGVAHGGR